MVLVSSVFRRLQPLRLSNSRMVRQLTSFSATVENAQLLNMDLPTNDKSLSLLQTRHTAAHVLAMAVQKLYPHAKVTIGPWIENG